jgi:hypothetical protein
LKAVIVGGRIGGLATALACTRAGIEAEVYERAPGLHEIGARLSLWSNAVAALARLGVRDEVIARSDPIERSVTVTSDGEVLSDVSASSRRSWASRPYVHIAPTCNGRSPPLSEPRERGRDRAAQPFHPSRIGQGQATSGLLAVLRHDLPALNAPA